jgi:putative heme iron utilization protein
MKGLAEEAREMLEKQAWGLLSSHSARHPGYPFGSVTPYAWRARDGVLLLFMSTLAEHTRNVAGNPRCSLLVLDGANPADLQESGRMTVVGDVVALPASETEEARGLYLARHAEAERLFGMKDFSFFAFTVQHARFIAGFGKMGWLSAEDIRG